MSTASDNEKDEAGEEEATDADFEEANQIDASEAGDPSQEGGDDGDEESFETEDEEEEGVSVTVLDRTGAFMHVYIPATADVARHTSNTLPKH